jgi:hypothetical protein
MLVVRHCRLTFAKDRLQFFIGGPALRGEPATNVLPRQSNRHSVMARCGDLLGWFVRHGREGQ